MSLFSNRLLPFHILIGLGLTAVLFGVSRDGDEDEGDPVKAVVRNADSGNSPLENFLSGTVNINGKPLTSGGVLLVFGPSSPQPVAVGFVNPDGSYRIDNAPLGHVQLCFSTDKELGSRWQIVLPGKKGFQKGNAGRKLGLGKEAPNIRDEVMVQSTPGSQRLSEPKKKALKEQAINDLRETREAERLVHEAAKKYGRLGLPDAIKTVVIEGENSFDIALTIEIAETH